MRVIRTHSPTDDTITGDWGRCAMMSNKPADRTDVAGKIILVWLLRREREIASRQPADGAPRPSRDVPRSRWYFAQRTASERAYGPEFSAGIFSECSVMQRRYSRALERLVRYGFVTTTSRTNGRVGWARLTDSGRQLAEYIEERAEAEGVKDG